MADLVIRGMKMPTHCLRDCPVCDCERMVCKAEPFARPVDWTTDTVPEWCPLVPLPEGHGRLGDLDALLESMRESYQKAQEWRDNSSGEIYNRADATVMAFLEFGNRTKNAATIVPAEGGTDDAPKTD